MKKQTKFLAFFIAFALLFSSCNASCSSKTSNKNDTPKNLENAKEASRTILHKNAQAITPAPKVNTPKPTLSPSIGVSNLSTKEKDWGFRPNSKHETPEIAAETQNLLKKYSTYFVGDTSNKILYLTFDEGYENGYTPKILDILKANDVKAAFFVTVPYIKSQPDLIKRMVNEGHLVCNHSWHHPSMAKKALNEEAFNAEFTETEKVFKEITNTDMPKFFRPPMGKYSEKSLCLTQKLGYKTILWSFAHADWDVKKQPSVEETHNKVIKRVHNGCIILLHAVSKSDTEALDSILKDLKKDGYKFESLNALK